MATLSRIQYRSHLHLSTLWMLPVRSSFDYKEFLLSDIKAQSQSLTHKRFSLQVILSICSQAKKQGCDELMQFEYTAQGKVQGSFSRT